MQQMTAHSMLCMSKAEVNSYIYIYDSYTNNKWFGWFGLLFKLLDTKAISSPNCSSVDRLF
jgi:hypothetical protein